jgi:hypothetical protein
LGSLNWDGNLRLFAAGGGGGLADPAGAPRGYLAGDNFGSELGLFMGNGQTGAVVSSRSPGGQMRLRDAFGTLTTYMGTTVGGGDLNLFQMSGDPGIKLNGDRSTFSNANSSGGEISVHTRGGQVGLLLDGDHENAGRIEVRQAGNLTPFVDIFGLGRGRAGEIRVKDDSGTETATIYGRATETRAGQLDLSRTNGTTTVILTAQESNNQGAALQLSNREGQLRALLDGDRGDGSGELIVYNAEGLTGVSVDGDTGGAGFVRVYNANGGVRIVLDGEGNAGGGEITVDKAGGAAGIRLQGEDNDGKGRVISDVVKTDQILVNTATPAAGYAVSVNGRMICEELVVQESGDWPDYVFAEDYALMPLEQLEASIKANKHLPGIPSAGQVSREGISIGQMQHHMMEKIEELTLYILDQDKQLKDLRAQLENRQP